MNRRTVLDARMYGIPDVLGACVGDNGEFLRVLNEAQQRLIFDQKQPDEGWWGTWGVIAFNLDGSNMTITGPRDMARITAIDVCKKPVVIRNQFWEYLEFGNGLRPASCTPCPLCEELTAFDRGVVISQKDLTPPNKVLRVYPTDETDIGKRVLLAIKDQFGNIVYGQDGFNRVTGEYVNLTSPFAQTANQVSVWFGAQKDITNGQVQVHQVDTITGEQELLLTMEPNETTACYRRYFVNGLPNACCGSDTIQCSALVKLDLLPVTNDTDYLLIGNLAALKEECQAIRYDDMDAPAAKANAARHHNAALRLLMGELDHYVGKERVSIQVPLWNSDRLQRQPL